MIEPTTIAVAAVAYIALKIAEGGFEEIGKDIYGKVKNSLKPDELIKLNLLESNPEDNKLQGEVAEILAKRLEEKPEIAEQLQRLLQSVNQSSVNINRQEGSETNINVQGNQNTSFNFNPK